MEKNYSSFKFVPDRGQLIWLSFNPQIGREQAGRRPALVLSPASYNKRSGLVIVCPITNQIKHFPFEVLLPSGLPISGVILTDHLKNLDWNKRKAELICQVPSEILTEVQSKLTPLLNL